LKITLLKLYYIQNLNFAEPIDLEPMQESDLIGAEASQSDYVENQSEAATQQGIPSSSVEERVIVLSSSDEEEGDLVPVIKQNARNFLNILPR